MIVDSTSTFALHWAISYKQDSHISGDQYSSSYTVAILMWVLRTTQLSPLHLILEALPVLLLVTFNFLFFPFFVIHLAIY